MGNLSVANVGMSLFGFIFALVGLLILLALLPLFEATGFLLGISVLAPIFALALSPKSKRAASEESLRYSPYYAAMAYSMSTIMLLIQLFLFATGESQDRFWYTYTFFDTGFFFFAIASALFTVLTAYSYVNVAISLPFRVVRYLAILFIGLLYATRLTFFVAMAYETLFTPHAIALVLGFAFYAAFARSCLSKPEPWHIVYAGIAILVVSISIILVPYTIPT